MLKVKKIDFFVTSIFGIYIKFQDFLFLSKYKTVLLALTLPALTTLLLLALNAFGVAFYDLVIFNNEINDIAILLKAWIKCL